MLGMAHNLGPAFQLLDHQCTPRAVDNVGRAKSPVIKSTTAVLSLVMDDNNGSLCFSGNCGQGLKGSACLVAPVDIDNPTEVADERVQKQDCRVERAKCSRKASNPGFVERKSCVRNEDILHPCIERPHARADDTAGIVFRADDQDLLWW